MIFAVLHLLGAGINLLGALIVRPFFTYVGETDTNAKRQAMWNLQAEFRWLGVASDAADVVLAGILIFAGIKLLKKQSSGAKWSRIYAWLSISLTVIFTLVNIFYRMPEMRKAYEASGLGVPDYLGSNVDHVVLAVKRLVYPGMVLVFLGARNVREWFAAREV